MRGVWSMIIPHRFSLDASSRSVRIHVCRGDAGGVGLRNTALPRNRVGGQNDAMVRT